jgi:hypothetical protein
MLATPASRYRMFHFTSSSAATGTKPASSLTRIIAFIWIG